MNLNPKFEDDSDTRDTVEIGSSYQNCSEGKDGGLICIGFFVEPSEEATSILADLNLTALLINI
uniref:Uncharacterized protein n=1 Tax=Heterorhabditis bacteriophora TaxID=37862 RepID=A0A1I7XUU1_HETBA